MSISTHHLFAFSSSVRQIRTWEDKSLPLSQSRIAFDLYILIALSCEIERPFTLKEIFNSLNYSERGMRYVLDQMIDGGWCNLVGNENDKRCRLVVGTNLMRSKLSEYKELVLSTYASHQ
jgi:DNA-binding MarR family transcriptional regulator